MKYSASNKPLICMQTTSHCYKNTYKMEVKGILWHSTGANNPNLKRYVQPSDDAVDKDEWIKLLGKNTNKTDWNHTKISAGLNCWIGKLADGTVTTVQTMPWDYRPWGCGKGSKGSCNNGWIQFEICEGNLTDKNYFEQVYTEACEITAYLCEMFDIDPYGTVSMNGVDVPTILCHADAHKLGFGSNHGDVNHWFPKHGKSMKTVRDDVAKLLKKTPAEIYRVRKDWNDAKSQIGAYSDLDNAKEACDQAGAGYEVYNSAGKVVYSKAPAITFKKGDTVKLVKNATYANGKTIPSWVLNSKLYIRSDVAEDGTVIISTQASGAITGTVRAKDLVKYSSSGGSTSGFKPYMVRVEANVLNVRAGAGTNYKVTTQIKKGDLYTIVEQKGRWGKLKSGAGWIHLDYVKKI